MAEEYINGNRRITLTVNDAIKGVVFIVTMCGVGYSVQRRMDQMQAEITVLSGVVAAQTAQLTQQGKDIEEWKRATSDLVFRPRSTFKDVDKR